MIPWWWVLIALVVGEFIGIVVPGFCGFNEREFFSHPQPQPEEQGE